MRSLRWYLPSMILAGCVSPAGEPTRTGENATEGRHGESGTHGGADSVADTDDSGDEELDWDGPVAAFDGCGPGDPPALLLSQEVPTGPVSAGSAISGSVIFANCGETTWIAAETDDATDGVKLGAVSDTVMETWGLPRVRLPVDVPPDHAVRLLQFAEAPWTNGEHRWQWQIVDESVAWLEAPTPTALVEVTDGYGPFEVHTRDEWQTAAQPVEGPAMDLLDLRYIVLHYNGATADLDGPDDLYTDEDTIADLRDSQASYLSSRGYSYGYNSEIAPDGDEWEVRGFDIRSGANGCIDTNRAGYAIQIPTTSPEDPPTVAQVEGTRAAILRIRLAAAAAGNTDHLEIVGHGDVRPTCSDGAGTLCPGEPIRTLMEGGALEP